ncbi:hypothetical protein AFK24_24815 [Pseudomonas syringae]|uniref:Uncharacterized protein n=1 Tax=Pseudomonas syringae TaxID=317 RepID=A0A1C7YXC7_PSESX|nr:hypothetical protein AFK24_24815 [Pseudomonas syringae]
MAAVECGLRNDPQATLTTEVCVSCEEQCRKFDIKHAECKACADAFASSLREYKALTVARKPSLIETIGSGEHLHFR